MLWRGRVESRLASSLALVVVPSFHWWSFLLLYVDHTDKKSSMVFWFFLFFLCVFFFLNFDFVFLSVKFYYLLFKGKQHFYDTDECLCRNRTRTQRVPNFYRSVQPYMATGLGAKARNWGCWRNWRRLRNSSWWPSFRFSVTKNFIAKEEEAVLCKFELLKELQILKLHSSEKKNFFFFFRIDLQEHENFGVASIFKNLLLMFSVRSFTSIDALLFKSFIQTFTTLTCTVGRLAAQEESVSRCHCFIYLFFFFYFTAAMNWERICPVGHCVMCAEKKNRCDRPTVKKGMACIEKKR